MKKSIYAYLLIVCLCFSSSVFAQSFGQLPKENVDGYFQRAMQNRGLSYNNGYYQLLTDSLAVIVCDATGRNGFGMPVTNSVVYFYLRYRDNGEVFYWNDLYAFNNTSSNLFSSLEHPFIPQNQLRSIEPSLFTVMTYEDAMYYRFMYYIGLTALKGQGMSVDDRNRYLSFYTKTIKTGLWIRNNELDDFGDPVGVSLSCPLYSKKMKDGNVEAENLEFFLNISADNIKIIPPKFEFFNSLRKHTISIKDASGNQLTCSLDKNLNIVSNALNFLRVIEREGVIKGVIAEEDGKSYTFSLYLDGYNAAKKATKLITNSITNADKTKVEEKVTSKKSTEATSQKSDSKNKTRERMFGGPEINNLFGTYEIVDKAGKRFRLTLNEDDTAIIVYGNNNKCYCSLAYTSNQIWIEYSGEKPGITISGDSTEKYYPYLILRDGWVYTSNANARAMNPNLRVKATKIK